MTENERVRELRKNFLKMTLTEFGEVIGLGNSSISDIETGRRNLTQQTRLSICRAFHVREAWLRDGDGEPFQVPDTRDEEIQAFVGSVLQAEGEDFKRRLLHVLSHMSEDQWSALAELAEQLARENDETPTP